MDRKFELYLGLNDKETKRQEINTLDAYKVAANVCKDCSISELTGYYTHDNGAVVIEKSLKIELFGKEKTEVQAIAEQLKTIFNQELVIINEILVNSQFI